MSLFSRFRKPPPPPAAVAPRESVPAKAPVPAAVDRDVLADREEQSLTAAIGAGDTTTVTRLVIEGMSTRIRQRAAQAVDDPEQIRQLLRDARGGKDKTVHKILAGKRDALLARQREVEQLQVEITAAAAALERHSHRPYDPLFTPTLEQLEKRWHAVAAHAAQDVTRATQQAVDRSRETIAQHLREVAAKAARELAAANAAALAQKQREQEARTAADAAAEQARITEDERKAKAEKLDADTHALRDIGGLLRKAHGALAAGRSGSAAGLRRAVDEKLAAAPPLPAALANQLRQLDAKLQDLKDWRSYSVAPKRIELIERMESLIGATMHPSTLAGHIKDLQEQWRTLSKGAGEGAEADWQRFHEAAQKAYQPCREHFEAQAQVKQENLRQRGLLLQRLANFAAEHDWQQPDWRTVVTALRESRQLWRQHSPVDADDGAALQSQFNDLTATLQVRVDAEYARNVNEKRSLIERARGLLQASDMKQAVDDAKRLQERWKSVGPVPRDEDHRLWEEFRQHCDALFQKRQQEFASHSEAMQGKKSQAAALCEELESIAGLSGEPLIEQSKRLPQLRSAFEEIGELPRANARQLRDRFERAFDRCHRAVAGQHARDAEQGWSDLLDAADLVRAYRLAIARRAEATECDELKRMAEQRLTETARWPKRGVEVLRNALAQAGESDPAANELALRTLCIRAEIATDSPTPSVDQSLRREYQMQRLMDSMGHGVRTEQGQFDDLTIQWLDAGPVETGVYRPLLERFNECRGKALSRRLAG